MKNFLAFIFGLFLISTVTASYGATMSVQNNKTSIVQTVDLQNQTVIDKVFLKVKAYTPKPKSQLVALLLCFFGGGLGLHRFYLGYTMIGILQLLTAGGFGIWALIDLIRIITGDLKPADGSEYDPKLDL